MFVSRLPVLSDPACPPWESTLISVGNVRVDVIICQSAITAPFWLLYGLKEKFMTEKEIK